LIVCPKKVVFVTDVCGSYKYVLLNALVMWSKPEDAMFYFILSNNYPTQMLKRKKKSRNAHFTMPI